jgi:hypothetical protein
VVASDLAIGNSHGRAGSDTPALGLVDAGGKIEEGSGLALDDQIERGLSGRVAQHYFATGGLDRELVLRNRCRIPAGEGANEQR